jgi:hypothetical protein
MKHFHKSKQLINNLYLLDRREQVDQYSVQESLYIKIQDKLTMPKQI